MYVNIFDQLTQTDFFFVNFRSIFQMQKMGVASGIETEISPKGRIRETKEAQPTVAHRKRYVYFAC